MAGQVQIPIFINPVSTQRGLENGLTNSFVVRDIESLQTTADNIYTEPYPSITSLDDLLHQLSEVVIRFDNGAKHLTKEDLMHLCKLLQGSLIYLYQVSGGEGEFNRLEQLIQELDQRLSGQISADEAKYDDYVHLAGCVTDKEELDAIPVEQLHKGDFYRAGNDEYIWSGMVWIKLGPDVSIYATTEWVLQQLQSLTKTVIGATQDGGITVEEIKQGNVVIGYNLSVDESVARSADLIALAQEVANNYYNKTEIDAKFDAIDFSPYMLKDGSNYEGDLALVTPSIAHTWTIKDQQDVEKSTSHNANISVENGAKVDYIGTASIPTPSASQKAPTGASGSWTFINVEAGAQAVLETSNVTSSVTYNCTFTAPKSGLIVSNNKVVKATGNDTTSSSASVSFQHRRFWGTSATASSIDLATLSSELSNSKSKTITYNCSGGKYFYYAIPKSLGNITTTVGGLSYTGWVTEDRTITNEYGYQVEYRIYRSGDIQTGSAITVVIS